MLRSPTFLVGAEKQKKNLEEGLRVAQGRRSEAIDGHFSRSELRRAPVFRSSRDASSNWRRHTIRTSGLPWRSGVGEAFVAVCKWVELIEIYYKYVEII